MFFKKILSYFDTIDFSHKTNFLLFIITWGMVCIIFLSVISIFSLKQDFDVLFEQRTKPLVQLGEIKDTYKINIYDTFYDIQHDGISYIHAKEVLSLAKQLIGDGWRDYKKRINSNYYKPSYITSLITSVYPISSIKEKKILQTSIINNIEKKNKIIDVLMEDILKFLEENKTTEALVLVDKLYFEINSINIYLTSLINYDLNQAINEKRKTEKVFNIMIVISIIAIAIVFLFSIILSIIIINNFKKLHNSLELKVAVKTNELQKLNDSLEKRIKIEVTNNRKKDLIMFQQAKLASLGEMLQNIAHQWRQPLGSLTMIIQSFQTKMIHGKLTDEFVDRKVQDSLLLAKNMSNTLNDFRNFFNPDKDKTEFLLRDCLDHSLELSKYLLEKERITFTCVIKDNVTVNGFYNELSHVFLNIISNSKDALASKDKSEAKLICIVIKKVDDMAKIIMIDNAGGIPHEVLPKVFEPYYTTKYKSAGTGIGLYMSKQIVEKHMAGTITCRNIKHKLGTDRLHDCAKFIISIPINQ